MQLRASSSQGIFKCMKTFAHAQGAGKAGCCPCEQSVTSRRGTRYVFEEEEGSILKKVQGETCAGAKAARTGDSWHGHGQGL